MKKLLLLVLLPVLFGGCHHGMLSEVKGSGKRQTETRQVALFTSIETEGAFNVDVVCGKGLRVEVEADDNILPLITTEVSGNKLILTTTLNPTPVSVYTSQGGTQFDGVSGHNLWIGP